MKKLKKQWESFKLNMKLISKSSKSFLELQIKPL